MAKKNSDLGRTYKSLLFEILPAAIEAERSPMGTIDTRGLFYACRRIYLGHPERPYAREAYYAARKGTSAEEALTYFYFSQKLIPEYEEVHGEIDGLTSEPRSHLHEAHTDLEEHEIGTQFVKGFEPPNHYYDKCIFVEKHGIALGLLEQSLGQKYDAAIVASRGYGTVADRNLLAAFAEEGYEIYVVHDCDPDGYGILANLQVGNERVGPIPTAVVDIGLNLEDAEDMGLIGEDATRQKALPENIGSLVSDEEWNLFTGTRRNAKVHDYRRYELNEIPADFRMPYVERKLEEAGVGPKVVPPQEFADEDAAERVEQDIESETEFAVDEIIDLDAIKAAMVERFKESYNLPDSLPDALRERLKEREFSSWRGVLGQWVGAEGLRLRSEINEAVKEAIKDTLSTEGGEEA
jgi:hypothetical protein